MKRIITVIICAALCVMQAAVICGCAEADGDGTADITSSTRGTDGTTGAAGAGTSLLPESMPEDFSVRFECWIVNARHNILDTGEGFVQKDLVNDGTAKTDYTADRKTLEAIYASLRSCALDLIVREMTSDALAKDELHYAVTPLTCYSVTFSACGTVYTVTGDATANGYISSDPEAAAFMTFIRYINVLLYNSEEYKSLPAANGGYD